MPPRQDIKEKLILATLDCLEEAGVNGVQARTLAKTAGCSVGTIYNLVGNLDNLILLANARTLNEFREFATVRHDEARHKKLDNRQLLEVLAGAYIDFASAHKKRWQANFEIPFDENNEYREAYRQGQRQLLSMIFVVLKDIAPDEDNRELLAIGRALWASVHGISMMAMSNPANTLSRDKILAQCNRLINPVVDALIINQKKEAA